MGYKMKGFTYPGTKKSPLTRKAKNDPKNPEYLKYWRDPANRGELDKRSKFNIMGYRYKNLLAQIKAESEGGGGGGSSTGKHGDEMHTGTEAEMQKGKKFETGPAPKPIAPGKAPENKKEE